MKNSTGKKEGWIEIWFRIEKDGKGYSEKKSWEGLWGAPESREVYRIESVPFYLKNVSRGDKVSVRKRDFVEFNEVVGRGGHSTYRLLLREKDQTCCEVATRELESMGLFVEEEHGFFLAVDVPPEVDQTMIDEYLCNQSDSGRWEMQDGYLANVNFTDEHE